MAVSHRQSYLYNARDYDLDWTQGQSTYRSRTVARQVSEHKRKQTRAIRRQQRLTTLFEFVYDLESDNSIELIKNESFVPELTTVTINGVSYTILANE